MSVSLISAASLHKRLQGGLSDLCIIDTRPKEEYESGHIPGAIWVGWEDWCAASPDELGEVLKQTGYWGELSSLEDSIIANRLEQLGISSEREIVVYADGARSKGREGRIAWMLLYFGAPQVHILNGGWTAWKSAGFAVSEVPPVIITSRFDVHFQTQRRAMLPALAESCRRGRMPVMLDTRTSTEHVGELHRYMPRRGRIPDSELITYPSIFNADGTFLSREDYLRLVPKAVLNTEDTVTYCEVGVRAATIALLHELYTGKVLPLYDASMMEWGAQAELPVERLSDKAAD